MRSNPLRKYFDGTYGYFGAVRFYVSPTPDSTQDYPLTLTFPGDNDMRSGRSDQKIVVSVLELRQLAGNLLAVADDIEKQGTR